jgi:putative membrane protein insertion efficiency factor
MGEHPVRRVVILAVAIVVVVALSIDARRAPQRQLGAKLLLVGIHLYQHTISPLLPHVAGRCRMVPSCSHYGEQVIRRFGEVRGSWLLVRRLLRCGPWTPFGTVDEPPPPDPTPAAASHRGGS